MLNSLLLWASIVGGVRASQPGAASPIAAPMRQLVWGQLNFLHTTDTHGWLGGHLQEPSYSADWGDYVSFAEHMRRRADDKGVDVILIDTGDRVEGNGLYDASTPKGLFTNDVLREQHIDILCSGNHELYVASTAKREHESTVPIFKENYIASNVDYLDPDTGARVPQAPQRYRKFKTKNLGIEIIAFGFLFDFTNAANNTVVQPVAETIREDWFQKAIREAPDVFVVTGHVGLRMPEFKAIFAEIRKHNPDTPIAFFGGHVHVRDAVSYDEKAFGLASGRYFETVGWMSIDGVGEKVKDVAARPVKFTRRYIDNNLLGYYRHTGLNNVTFPTSSGRLVSDLIAEARSTLSLDFKFGCAPRDLWMSRAPYPDDNSIFTWLENEVLPNITTRRGREDVPRISILNTGGIRFDIFKGAFTRDSTYTISPFVSRFAYIPEVPYKVARQVTLLLNSGDKIFEESGLDPRLWIIPEQLFAKQMAASANAHLKPRQAEDRQQPLVGDVPDKPELTGGYTTRDDIGDNGDDTVHLPLSFYEVPNCVQAEMGFPADGEPDAVDLVFLDFLQPWIVVALWISGAKYGADDIETYREESFTYLMAEWIKEHWRGDC